MRTLIDQRLRRRLLILASMALGAVGASASRASAQTGTIVGHVTDARSGQGVQSVAIQIEGTRFTTGTNVDGRYRLTGVPVGLAHGDRATHRLLGGEEAGCRRRRSRGHDSTSSCNRALSRWIRWLITGTAGAQELRSVGNAVSTVNATEVMAQAQPPDITSLIKGGVAGVSVLDRSGRLGSGPTIQIRGRSSMGLENSPLIYIDGIRVNNATGTGPSAPAGRLGGQSSAVAGRLNDISP